MGLFQNLIETYDKCAEAVGIVPVDKDGNAKDKKTLLPIGHMTFKSEICITIDKKGNFVSVSRDAKEITIIVPCNEDSAGRSAGIAAHPLCDKIDYVGGINDKKTEAYLLGLNSWRDSIAELNAIYTYVSKKTMINDLLNREIFKDSEYQITKEEGEEKQLDLEKIRKIGVRFIVQGDGNATKVWENKILRDVWIKYILGKSEQIEVTFDYLSGETVSQIATQHPKNINSFKGNAKLLSCNDTSGFTFRGRFVKQNDAVIIDYAQSQKMHQMLRWLIANYGYVVDSQAFITWAVDSNKEVKVKPQDNSFEIFQEMKESKTDTEIMEGLRTEIFPDYARKLKDILQGYGSTNYIQMHSRKICIAVFDAATTGRMGLVFYQELAEDAYLENIINWHRDTSYYLTAWKKEEDEKNNKKYTPIHFIGAPSYDDILFAIYGKPRGDKSYDVLKKKTRKQLLECMFGNFSFPKSMIEMAANRASRPMAFTDSNGKFNESDWKRSISITCALARKYYKQEKEEIQLELDIGRKDRDYLFGRLLSVADKLERTALYKADKKDVRATNATRLMNAFQIKPYSTWGQLYSQLIPYKSQLNGAGFYQSLIDSIMVLFKDGDYENNAPLSPLYLLGYSAQNKVLSLNTKNEKSEGKENEHITE